MKYSIIYEKSFRKQYKRLERRGLDMSLLDDVIIKLANGEILPPQYRDHALQGDKRGYRDCHIKNDWILIYKLDKNVLTLILSETGTHSDIFR